MARAQELRLVFKVDVSEAIGQLEGLLAALKKSFPESALAAATLNLTDEPLDNPDPASCQRDPAPPKGGLA